VERTQKRATTKFEFRAFSLSGRVPLRKQKKQKWMWPPGLGSLAWFVLFIGGVVVLMAVGMAYIVWRGLLRAVLSRLVERGVLQPAVGSAKSAREHSVSGHWRHFIEIGILSVLLEIAALSIPEMNTPGAWSHGLA
jgi:hypothetical protein